MAERSKRGPSGSKRSDHPFSFVHGRVVEICDPTGRSCCFLLSQGNVVSLMSSVFCTISHAAAFKPHHHFLPDEASTVTASRVSAQRSTLKEPIVDICPVTAQRDVQRTLYSPDRRPAWTQLSLLFVSWQMSRRFHAAAREQVSSHQQKELNLHV